MKIEKGGDPERIRESQRRRYADVTLVDKVVEFDKKWRSRMLYFGSFRNLKGVWSSSIQSGTIKEGIQCSQQRNWTT